ncbi:MULTISPECIES: ORF6C domain-containing protein [unclassified Bacillus cereus group]|uniref:ORF6C domain-containing protein n=1 Tax=unclassified Bacillus cereus group TaxID=2750818 RepID=UPI001F56F1E1|nr:MULTISPECIES: ORF6C domain-containing protein [unclassified Bacillus cereus group]
MTDQLTVANELHILGKQHIAGYEFTGIEGGFGKGKKAMLVKEIAVIHGKQVWHINEAINKNRNRFKDGVDIIDLLGIGLVDTEIKNYGFSQQAINSYRGKKAKGETAGIYILSERGYAKLLKILEDDTAWELYDQFVDGYFNMREQQPRVLNEKESLLANMQATILLNEEVSTMKEDMNSVKAEVKDLKENTPLYATECDEIVKTVNKTAVRLLGGKQSNAYQNKSTRGKVYKDIYRELRRHFDVKSYKAIKRRYLEAAKKKIVEYELPIVLSEEIAQVNNQLTAEL